LSRAVICEDVDGDGGLVAGSSDPVEGGVGDRDAERLVGDEQGVDLLVESGRGAGAQYPGAEGGLFELQKRGLDFSPVVGEPHELGGGAVGIEDGGDQSVDPALVSCAGGDGDLAADDAELDRAAPRHLRAVTQAGTDREVAAGLDPDQQLSASTTSTISKATICVSSPR
jgi:hypothetical protein